MSVGFISDDYYDNETYTMLLQTLTDDDKEYIANYKENNEEVNNEEVNIKNFMFIRWSTIINALPPNYYIQYYSQTTSEDRNAWFQRYLDYPTKNILEMPEIL
jgi:hypothetical protein